MTCSRLNRMHIGNPYYHHCGDAIETTLHVLRDCPLAEAVWLNSFELQFRTNFYTTDLRDWIEQNLNRKRWAEFWPTTCHTLWYWRNKLVHDEEFVIPASPWQLVESWKKFGGGLRILAGFDLTQMVLLKVAKMQVVEGCSEVIRDNGFEGLKLARSHGYRKVELHIDSSSVVSSISRDQGGIVVGLTLLHNIRRLIDQRLGSSSSSLL
ncbi:hypothetical protein MTR_4g054275 [Medicago truncatula]|uniref:RNase H type-1 domain-containing protein n=1 Tax=Medicago truncatula TaxID=3880 RepID=A0A072ULG2_MEDTR|nr:hypothetical protein MTR_4g054275 [Medicago truncatula]